MSRATRLCPRGDFVHVARLGGYYDLKYYRRCDHLIGNTRAIVDYADRQRLAARADRLPAEFRSRCERRGRRGGQRRPLGRARRRWRWRWAGFIRTRGSICCSRRSPRPARSRLWIAGDGPLRPRLERLAARLGITGRVRFLGWREDVPRLLASADFLVCPVAARAARQCRDRGLVRRIAGRRHGERRAGRADRGWRKRDPGAAPGSRGGGPQALADAIERVCARSRAARATGAQRAAGPTRREFTEADRRRRVIAVSSIKSTR